MEGVIRVVVVDDHPVTRAGLCAVFSAAPGIEVVAECADGYQARDLTTDLQPDVLLLDLQMPGPRPSEIVAWALDHSPATTVLILTAHDRDVYLSDMMDAGAAGFLTKDETSERLVEAVVRAARGELLFSLSQYRRARLWRRDVGTRWASLTKREQAVLQLVAGGKTDREIAQSLAISPKTVGNHVSRILDKLDVGSRTEAAMWAVSEGLVEPSAD